MRAVLGLMTAALAGSLVIAAGFALLGLEFLPVGIVMALGPAVSWSIVFGVPALLARRALGWSRGWQFAALGAVTGGGAAAIWLDGAAIAGAAGGALAGAVAGGVLWRIAVAPWTRVTELAVAIPFAALSAAAVGAMHYIGPDTSGHAGREWVRGMFILLPLAVLAQALAALAALLIIVSLRRDGLAAQRSATAVVAIVLLAPAFHLLVAFVLPLLWLVATDLRTGGLHR